MSKEMVTEKRIQDGNSGVIKITDLKMNHLENPIGYDMDFQTFSWKWSAQEQKENLSFRVCVAREPEFQNIIYDSGYAEDLTGVACECRLRLEPRTRYYWKVMVKEGDIENQSEIAFFETGKQQEAWIGKWIGMPDTKTGKASPVVRKEFVLEEADTARLYVTGTGLYECYMNGQLVNDGYLQPGFNNYNFWHQTQSFDATPFLKRGKNVVGFLMGDGWYRGRFGVNGGMQDNFGTGLHLLMELHIVQKGGKEQVIASDESFRYTEGPVRFSNIYDGEIYDALVLPEVWMQPGYSDSMWKNVVCVEPERMEKLVDRFSLPVRVMEKIKPVSLDKAPDGTMILDMGQNMTGWIVFRDMLPRGKKICLQYAELLQDGKLCQKNLKTAKQEFVYISDGKGNFVRPHFTYFGFRYVQISGDVKDIEKDCFTGWCLYSSMPTTMKIETGNQKVNQLISNVMWSQRDNFLEHPSDCPQRAERLGWTGDAQIYCRTASYNMETPVFFRKYIKDVNEEQQHKNGLVPFIVPKIAGKGFENPTEDECSAAWSDAAVIIPWVQYVFFGDKNILREEYPGMKAWVEYIYRRDVEDGNKALWNTGFQFGDWLALDNPEQMPFGKTDSGYIASCFYYYSSLLTSKAARVLDMEEDAAIYAQLAERVKNSILKTYFDENGILKQDTQTGYAMAIYLKLVPEDAIRENGRLLAEKIRKNENHLDTGFVGTPYLLLALSRAGFDSMAYDLLLQEEYPGWLYEVNLGATTIWEAWDALDSEGRLTGEMSLNHYAFGSVAEWIYSECSGIRPIESYPGFQKVRIEPKPDKRLGYVSSEYHSAVGTYQVEWKYLDEERVKFRISVPDGATVYFKMPGDDQVQELKKGDYEIIRKL